MSGKGTLLDDLKQAKRLKIVYKENGEKKQKTGTTEEMIVLLNKIISDPKKFSWLLIKKFY